MNESNQKLEYLKSGYSRFRQKYFLENNNIFDDLKVGQHPATLVIACSDSRVDPAIILDCAPGDLFVIRNVANLVPPCESGSTGYHGTSAALEFGVTGLKVKNIIVLGHSSCGGISSLFEVKNSKSNNKSFVDKWMEITGDIHKNHAIDENQKLDHKINQCSQLAIVQSLKNLMSFPWINEAVNKGELMIHGWYFDISTGKINSFDKNSNRFIELV